MDEAALLEGLDAAQLEAVLTDAAPLGILAGAGSGKTRVLSHRIAWRVLDGSADASHVLAVTFTRRAAGELQRRLGRLGLRGRLTAGTFHGVAWAVLRSAGATNGAPDPSCSPTAPGCWRRSWASWADAARRPGARGGGGRRDRLGPGPHGVARPATPRRSPRPAASHRCRPPAGRGVLGLRRREAPAARSSTSTTSSTCAPTPLETDPPSPPRSAGASATSSSTSSRTSTRSSSACSRPGAAAGHDLCVVGDPNQAIYAWNGADPRSSTALRPRSSAARRSCASTATTGPRRRCSPSPTAVLDAARRRRPAAGAGPTGPCPRCTASPATPTRPAPSSAPAAPSAGRAGGGRAAPSSPARTPSWAPIERALRRRLDPGRLAADRPLLDLPVAGGAAPRRQRGAARQRPRASSTPADDRRRRGRRRARAEPAGSASCARSGASCSAPARRPRSGPSGRWLAARRRRRRRRGRRRRRCSPSTPPRASSGPVVRGRRRGRARPPPLGHRLEGRAEETQAPLRRAHPGRATSSTARGPARRDGRRERSPRPCSSWSASRRCHRRPRRRRGSPAGCPPATPGADGRCASGAPARPLAADVPEHAVCSDDQLSALATVRPTTLDELAGVLGPVAARRLAPRLLPVLAEAERVASARRSLRACIRLTKTSGLIETNRASASADSVSPSWRVAEVWILRPSTRSTRPSKRSSRCSGVGER